MLRGRKPVCLRVRAKISGKTGFEVCAVSVRPWELYVSEGWLSGACQLLSRVKLQLVDAPRTLSAAPPLPSVEFRGSSQIFELLSRPSPTQHSRCQDQVPTCKKSMSILMVL